MKFPSFRPAWIAAALALAALAAPLTACADPNVLWAIVHAKCAPNEAASGDPSPCLAVDLAGGYAVLKDRRGATQVLVIPTAKVTGIEDPAVLAPGAPNYWREAWAARRYVQALAGQIIPRDKLSLAVNSMYGRSQNQLHIHVDCIRADVRDALKANLASIGPAWAPIDLGPHVTGHYEAMRLAGDDLGARNPFALLAAGDPAARGDMGLETLLVAPVDFADGPGFVLLADRASPGDAASAEELQDHACKVLQAAG